MKGPAYSSAGHQKRKIRKTKGKKTSTVAQKKRSGW